MAVFNYLVAGVRIVVFFHALPRPWHSCLIYSNGHCFEPDWNKNIVSTTRAYNPNLGRFISRDPSGGSGSNLYAYCADNPICGIDPLGLDVFLVEHTVAAIGNHAYIYLQPDNPSDFANNPLFQSGASTISGEPIPAYSPFNSGPSTLNSVPNADLNSNPSAVILIQTPTGMTDTEFINSLLAAANSFNNGILTYNPIPTGDTYNSNSFAAAILTQAGLNGNQLVNSLPGWQPGNNYPNSPIPSSSFGGGSSSTGTGGSGCIDTAIPFPQLTYNKY